MLLRAVGSVVLSISRSPATTTAAHFFYFIGADDVNPATTRHCQRDQQFLWAALGRLDLHSTRRRRWWLFALLPPGRHQVRTTSSRRRRLFPHGFVLFILSSTSSLYSAGCCRSLFTLSGGCWAWPPFRRSSSSSDSFSCRKVLVGSLAAAGNFLLFSFSSPVGN